MEIILQALKKWVNSILILLEWTFFQEILFSEIFYFHYLSNTMILILL